MKFQNDSKQFIDYANFYLQMDADFHLKKEYVNNVLEARANCISLDVTYNCTSLYSELKK